MRRTPPYQRCYGLHNNWQIMKCYKITNRSNNEVTIELIYCVVFVLYSCACSLADLAANFKQSK